MDWPHEGLEQRNNQAMRGEATCCDSGAQVTEAAMPKQRAQLFLMTYLGDSAKLKVAVCVLVEVEPGVNGYGLVLRRRYGRFG